MRQYRVRVVETRFQDVTVAAASLSEACAAAKRLTVTMPAATAQWGIVSCRVVADQESFA